LRPSSCPALETVKNLAVATNQWVRQNGALFRTILAIGIGLVAAGAAVTAIGTGIFVLGSVLGAAATVATALASMIAFVATPVGLVVAGLVALGAAIVVGTVYWLAFTESGKRAFAAVLAALKPFAETVMKTFRGIGDALKAGDLELAARIAARGIQLVFVNMAIEITRAIRSVADAFFASKANWRSF
jgi:hypothetical protein